LKWLKLNSWRAAAFSQTFREAAPENPSNIFIEALTEPDGQTKGLRYRIRVIQAGVSKNNVLYPDAVLREATPLLDGVRVYVKSDTQHLQGQGRSFNQLIGQLKNPKFIEAAGDNPAYIESQLYVLQSAGDTAAKLLEAFNRGMTDLFGFSIDAEGKAKSNSSVAGLREATSIERFNSVDLIIEPGAGGKLLSLLESAPATDAGESMPLSYRTTATPPAQPDQPLTTTPISAAPHSVVVPANYQEAANAAVQTVVDMREAIANSGLPTETQARLRQQFDSQTGYTLQHVTAAIQAETNYISQLREAGHVQGLGTDAWGNYHGGRDRSEGVAQMLDNLLHPENGIQYSLREAYIDITGDRNVTGQMSNFDMRRYREAFAFREAVDSATFGFALSDAIHRRLLQEYQQQSHFDAWRPFVEIDRAPDFRDKHLVRMGGYGDLPDVAEGAPYSPLGTPADEEATYKVSKKGGTESLTLEAIKNDDVRLLRRIPVKLNETAKRTLGKFVFNLIRHNPVIYDGQTLLHASRNNLGTSPLSKAAFSARRKAMMKITEAGSNEQMSIPPRYMLVPIDLEDLAYDLFVRNQNLDPDFVQTVKPKVISVWYWTDPDDWFLVADWRSIPGIVIGFLDGQQEPMLFVQDNPNHGSVFSNDKITYKIKHVFGGGIADYRGIQGSIVP